MKKMFIAFFAAVLAFTVGCSNGAENAAQDWIDAVKDGDLDAAVALCTGLPAEATKMLNEQAIKSSKGDDSDPTIESSEIDGDKATVKFKDGGKIHLKKVDGEWKVDLGAMAGM